MSLFGYISAPLAISLFILCLTWFLLSFWSKNRNLPPGPRGIPYFGYYPFLSPKPYLDFARLAERYGDVFSFRTAGGTLFVVLNSIKAIKEVLVNRSEEFIGRPLESNLLEWLSDGLGVTQEEGAPWKEHRRFFLQTVKSFGFGKQEIEVTIQDLIRTMLADLRKTDGHQKVDLTLHVGHVVNSTIMQIMFGKKLDKNGDVFPRLVKAVKDLIAVFADNRFMLVGIPFRLSLYLRPWSSDVRQGQSFLKQTVKDIIDEHVRTYDPGHLRDYVDSYLHEREKQKKSGNLEGSTFTMERLLSISMNMTMEGTESTGDSVCILLTQASRYPEEQLKVQEELDTVVGREALPSWADRKRLPYLEAFIQELYRTRQPFSITTQYCNFEETTLNGYRIPKRSILVGNLWSINNDPEIYENPSEFNVNRFLGKDGKKIKTDGPYPFSMGKRDCVGQALAQMEVFLIIASILQNFTLHSTGEEAVVEVVLRD
ncbi:hypothetical protein JTE90_025994 [Oedothorax gibbosus]|uniref:Cytochrome P450 n=1 Tax=Oedothorax gibbosus TaxID=931172 RepID=A0AAV6UHM8_9ARAC|nr:hypothetical protein JTE90_025994 [Oedothorax gibbosus]